MSDLCFNWKTRMSDGIYRRKFIHTLSLFFCAIAVGISVSQTGPSLLDLQLITDTSTEQASLFITGTSLGGMVGSLSTGFIYGRWNKVLIMTFMLLGTAISITALPWCSSYGLMVLMHGLVGVFRSSFNTAMTVDVIRTWAPDSRVFMQVLKTCISVGGAVGPVITQTFLAPKARGNMTSESEITSPCVRRSQIDTDSQSNAGSSVSGNATVYKESQTTHVHFAYLITGVWFLSGSCIFLLQHLLSKEEKASSVPPGTYESLDKPLPRPVFVATMFFLFLMFFVNISVQTSYVAFLLTFAVNYLNWTKSEGATLTTVYWLCQAAGRFIVIFCIKFISPFRFIFISSILILIVTVGNIFSSLSHYNIGVWLCTGITGLWVSSQTPSLMIWTEESIMRLTPRIVSVFNFSITLPGMVIPQILAYLMQELTPLWMFYLTVILCCVQLLLLLFVDLWTRLVVNPNYSRVNRECKGFGQNVT